MRAIVLAAGKGKRLHSEINDMPKVMRLANGRPLLAYVLENIEFVENKDIYIVIGYKKEKIMEYFGDTYSYAEQKELLGTGHAVRSAEKQFEDYEGDVLVCYGDMPLFREDSFKRLIDTHIATKSDCTVMSAIIDNPPPYGRLVRNEKGKLVEIVETRDCTPEQLEIKELNVGVYVFKSKLLFKSLKEIKNANNQGEYYLTDVPAIMLKNGYNVEIMSISDETEICGVNTQQDLELCEKYMRERSGK